MLLCVFCEVGLGASVAKRWIGLVPRMKELRFV